MYEVLFLVTLPLRAVMCVMVGGDAVALFLPIDGRGMAKSTRVRKVWLIYNFTRSKVDNKEKQSRQALYE